jgi:hypothetical protein
MPWANYPRNECSRRNTQFLCGPTMAQLPSLVADSYKHGYCSFCKVLNIDGNIRFCPVTLYVECALVQKECVIDKIASYSTFYVAFRWSYYEKGIDRYHINPVLVLFSYIVSNQFVWRQVSVSGCDLNFESLFLKTLNC